MFSFAGRCRRRFLSEWQAIRFHFQKIALGILFGALVGLVVIFSALSRRKIYLQHLTFPLNIPAILCLAWTIFFALLGGLITVVSICKNQLNTYVRFRAFCCFWIVGGLVTGWFFLLFCWGSSLGATLLIAFALLASLFTAVCVWRNSLPIFLLTILLVLWLLVNLFPTMSVCIFA